MKDKIAAVFSVITQFVIKQKRYIGAVLVVALMVVILAFGMKGFTSDDNPMAGAYQRFDRSENAELSELLTTYYTAYASNDITTLESVAHPISDAEKSYIAFLSQYYESYTYDRYYTKRGVKDGDLLVSVQVEMKFKDVDSPAPGLDFFYVEKDENGKLFINNLYSAYNQENGEQEVDSTIAALIAEFEQQDDVLSLQAEVQKNFNELSVSDPTLNAFMTKLPQEAQQWAIDYKTAQEQAAAEAAAAEAAAAEEAAKAAEEAAKAEEEAKLAEEEANAPEVRVLERCNVRTEPDAESSPAGKAEQGEVYKKTSEYGEWAEVIYNGERAYIRLDLLEDVGAEDAEDEDSDDSDTSDDSNGNLAAGDKVRLSSTVNIRESMSQNSSKVAVAYEGETVTVVQSYSEGWTKVKYDGKEGYIKTEYLN